ncbi:LamG-like jellyroll fold domain-containing protein [Rhodopirellula sp. SWK7]|uniref:LamG-like jellyroll fold domain-containing protein n=1 Tax=Rhodopirellula sp. SWK7 TaxID=595460 RepID=UPI0002BDAEF7|nr:LamG-like jellyroll fold domain-containing protein [Rhodopirellula sp. SWK7]EMI42084.1 beta-galactosidase [Rhodopirellula sp. SWK7]
MNRPSLLQRLAASLLIVASAHCQASAHEGAHDHSHDPSDKPFTTRSASRVLPLATDEDAFHFVIYGDRTSGVPAGLKVLEQAVVDTNLLDPDLVMTVGDLVQGYNEAPKWMQEMREYRDIMEKLKMKWFPVAGNHDVYWRGKGEAPQGQHESNYEEHFGPLWYSFEHKNAGFVVLYSDEGDPVTNEKSFSEGRLQMMSDEQLSFLKQSLEMHKDLDHVFVFLHHPRWIGGGYEGGNWDVVHEMLREAGNVSAVFAGHIHHMRFDGPKDGIAYYALATTGGHLSADIPGAGYLHHLNVVTVRPESVTVAALPVGAVIDPTDFTPEFLAEVDAARSIRPKELSNSVQLDVDGNGSGVVVYELANTSPRSIDLTVSFDPATRDWLTSLDHDHFTIAAGETKQLKIAFQRNAETNSELTIPRLIFTKDYLGESARISLPPTSTPVNVKLAALPANFFNDAENRCLKVSDGHSAVRIESSELPLPAGPFTLEAWVNPKQVAGDQAIVAKMHDSEFSFFMKEGVPQFSVHLNGRYVSARATDVLTSGRWTHLAGVYDGSEVRLYVDGEMVSSKPGSGKRKLNRLPLYIGADPGKGGEATRPFDGKIDEVKISEGEVYQANFTPQRKFSPTDETIMLLHFDRQLGPFLLDHSSSAIRGTLGVNAELVPSF